MESKPKTRSEAVTLGLSYYWPDTPCKNGHTARRYVKNYSCMECHRLVCMRTHVKFRVEHLEKLRRYYAANRATISEKSREKYKSNTELRKKAVLEWSAKNRKKSNAYKMRHKAANPGAYRALDAERRAIERNAMPVWADKTKIKEIYKAAQEMTRATGVRHSVDHVIPLVNRRVCGLHVETNLQVVPLSDNLKKNNRFVSW